MKQHIKEKWLEALRSGKYKQGKNLLKTEDGYCCLGVLCDLHRKSTKSKRNKWQGSYYNCGNEYTTSFLPRLVQKWAGIDTKEGEFELKNGEKEYLTTLNDQGKSFKQIANYIERYF